MRRSRLEALLHDYVAGDLGETERREVERMLESDPQARALLEEVEAAQGALRLLRDRPEPPVSGRDAFPQTQAAIASQVFEARPKLSLEGIGTRYYRRLAIAAMLMLALTIGIFSIRGSGKADVIKRVTPEAAPDFSALSPLDLGRRPQGIPAADFLRFLERTSDPRSLRIEPVDNVIEIAEPR
jgi:anti-sigma factor RsiW